MKQKEHTKKLHTTSILLGLFSFMLCYVPLLVAIITGFTYESEAGKVALSISCIVALILSLINLVAKYSIRSTMWVLLLGTYCVLDNVMPYLIAIAVCTIIDEFVVSPLHKHYKNLYTINNEISRAQVIADAEEIN